MADKMNPAVKAQWVAALRSGEYKQGRGMLRDGDKFCCLGVLCNLHAQAHPEIARKQGGQSGHYLGDIYGPPEAVLRWAGLKRDALHATDLIGLNDAGRTFRFIAKIIEAKL